MTVSWCGREGGEKLKALMREGRKEASKFCFLCTTVFTVTRVMGGGVQCWVCCNRSREDWSCHVQERFPSSPLPRPGGAYIAEHLWHVLNLLK